MRRLVWVGGPYHLSEESDVGVRESDVGVRERERVSVSVRVRVSEGE